VGVNEGNKSYKSLITLKHVSCVDLTLLTFASFVNIHASCRIGPNAIDLEGTPSFTEANFPPLNQGKHQESSFYRTFRFEIFTLCSWLCTYIIGV
jgi:hypothetical protein